MEEDVVEEIDYITLPMGELAEIIDSSVAYYKLMEAGFERNKYRKFVSNLVTIYNKRAKTKIFKEVWWSK